MSGAKQSKEIVYVKSHMSIDCMVTGQVKVLQSQSPRLEVPKIGIHLIKCHGTQTGSGISTRPVNSTRAPQADKIGR